MPSSVERHMVKYMTDYHHVPSHVFSRHSVSCICESCPTSDWVYYYYPKMRRFDISNFAEGLTYLLSMPDNLDERGMVMMDLEYDRIRSIINRNPLKHWKWHSVSCTYNICLETDYVLYCFGNEYVDMKGLL